MSSYDNRLRWHFDLGRTEPKRLGIEKQIYPYALILPYRVALRGNMSTAQRVAGDAACLASKKMQHGAAAHLSRIASRRADDRKDLNHHPPILPRLR